MSGLDREILAERSGAVARHLECVSALLPGTAVELRPMTEAADGAGAPSVATLSSPPARRGEAAPYEWPLTVEAAGLTLPSAAR